MDQPLDKIISKILTQLKWKFYNFKRYISEIRSQNQNKAQGFRFFIMFMAIAFTYKLIITNQFLEINQEVQAQERAGSTLGVVSVEKAVLSTEQSLRDNYYILRYDKKTRSDVGFVDLRVLTLEDYFNYYGSPLAEHSDEFIKAAEKYNIDNWQLLPAIGMAETRGCQTGTTHSQRNCWGWGGADPTRWIFSSYPQAIDIISYNMIRGYTNKYLNAKDIQNTYCGLSCAQWGWRWAQGVNYYTRKINDFGEKYGLERTNEVYDWS